VAVSPDGSKVYVTNNNIPGIVSVIDTGKNTVTATIPVEFPVNVVVTPDGRRVYVTNQNSGTVSVIDATTNAVTATIPVGHVAAGIAVTPDGSKVYSVNARDNTVSIIATATNTVIDTIPVGGTPVAFGIFIQPPPRFAGAPGASNCYGQSVAALVSQFGGFNAAAAALGFSDIKALEKTISAFCEG
jgi:YVTN family beta-propeller protein